MGSDEYPSGTRHDIHDNDTDFIVDEKIIIDEVGEVDGVKYLIPGPTLVAELKVGIIYGCDHEF
jgi:hypothetical protein